MFSTTKVNPIDQILKSNFYTLKAEKENAFQDLISFRFLCTCHIFVFVFVFHLVSVAVVVVVVVVLHLRQRSYKHHIISAASLLARISIR